MMQHRARLADLRAARGGGLWCWLAALLVVASARAQVDREYFAQTPPHPIFRQPDTSRYNLKFGKLTAHLSANAQIEYNDNITLSDKNPVADFSIGPFLGVGFVWPLTREHVLQLDLGIGYRWYLNSPDANSINVAPSTHLDYTIYIDEVRVGLHDRFSIQVDPVTRGELSGGSGDLMAFRRMLNTTGLSVDYQATRDLGLYGGYDYTIDRSLSRSFSQLDRDDHAFYAGLSYDFSPRIKAGLLSSYVVSQYTERYQNDGNSLTIGPTVVVKLSKFITATASGGYTLAEYSMTGTTGDSSDYSGPSYQVNIQHVMSQRTTEYVRFGQSLGLGFGSNYTDTKSLQYGIKTMLTKAISLNAIVAYENLVSSHSAGLAAEESNRFLFYVGTGYQFTRLWSAGLSYSFGIKDSNAVDRDYVQNRLTLDLTRRF